MNYNKIKKNIDLKFNKKFKYIIGIFCILVILIFMIVSPKLVMAYSRNNKKKVPIYLKMINYAIPMISVANNQEDGFIFKNEKKISENSKINSFKLNDNDIQDNDVSNENTVSPAYDPSLKKTINVNKPEVLIYHTHTHESYAPGNASNADQSVNVCSVGDVIANELTNKYGISVIHDKTIHDNIYTHCYQKSGETVDKYLKKYGSFKLIIDLHRDSMPNKNVVTTNLNGKKTARFMFVVEKSNPNFKYNIQVVNKLINISNKLFPNLIRNKEIYPYNHGIGHFNQNKSRNSVLMEVGSYVNTTEEAQRTGKYLARIIAEYINRK